MAYYSRTVRGFDCSVTWLSRASWPKIITKAENPFIL